MLLTLARLLTVKATIRSSELMEAMIDGGSQLNLISATLTKECDLQVDPLLKLLAEGVDRGKLTVYRTTTVETTITNLHRRVKTHRILFIVTNL